MAVRRLPLPAERPLTMASPSEPQLKLSDQSTCSSVFPDGVCLKTLLGPANAGVANKTPDVLGKPACDRTVEEWMPELRKHTLAVEDKGLDGIATLERVVRRMIAARQTTPALLKAYHAVRKQLEAAQIAESFLREQWHMEQDQAAMHAEELIRETTDAPPSRSTRAKGRSHRRRS